MTTMAPEFAANRQTAGSQQSRLPHCRFSWPIRLGLLLCLVSGHASLQAQVVASLPNIVLEPGDRVNAVVVQGDGKIIVGGSFGSINGKPWRNLARLNADGTLDESFEPDPDGEVNALVLDTGSGYLYVGGNFARIGSVWDNARAQCAYVARVFLTGSLPPALWCPNPDGEVKAMALEPSSGDLFIGGSFTTVGSDPSPNLARLAEADGSADSRFNDLDTDGVIETLAVGGAYLYVGGSFTVIGTHTASNIARVIVSNGHLRVYF